MDRDRKLRDLPLILDHLNRKRKKMLLNRNGISDCDCFWNTVMSQSKFLDSDILNDAT